MACPTLNIQVFDAADSLKIVTNTLSIRNVLKRSIAGIYVIKSKIVKIETFGDPLRHIFLPFANVSFPITANAEQLKDLINTTWLAGGGGSGGGSGPDYSTILNNQLNKLNEIEILLASNIGYTGPDYSEVLNNQWNKLVEMSGIIQEVRLEETWNNPGIIDNTFPGVTYEAFPAYAGASIFDPVWAIRRKTNGGSTVFVHWADGDKFFDNIAVSMNEHPYF